MIYRLSDMCTNPRDIQVVNPYYNGATPRYFDHYKYFPRVSQFAVHCGKCDECILRRQSSHSARMYTEFTKHTYLYHITFTYAPEHLPWMARLLECDLSTGECEYIGDAEFRDDIHQLIPDIEVPGFHKRQSLKEPFSVLVPLYEYMGFQSFLHFTPSVRRYDLRESLKIARIYFKRMFKRNCDFRYSFCTEYGPKTFRPHAHLCIMSNDPLIRKFISLLRNYWQENYGFTYLTKPKRVNDNGSDGYFMISKYLAKYFSKGELDNPLCAQGLCEKCRICNSKAFGKREFDEAYYFAYDLYGEYDKNTLLCNGRTLDQYQIDSICDEIIKRQTMIVWQKSIILPKYYREKIYSYYVKCQGKRKRCRYKISLFLSQRLQLLYEARENKKLYKDSLFSAGPRISIGTLQAFDELSISQRKKRAREAHLQQLRSSIY